MSIFDALSTHAIVPVIALDDPAAALPLADALMEGGLPVAEITFRTDAARATIEAIAKARPEMLIGAERSSARRSSTSRSTPARASRCRQALIRRSSRTPRRAALPSRPAS
jgi:hypothetical protein